jgi:nucleoside phosphorylase
VDGRLGRAKVVVLTIIREEFTVVQTALGASSRLTRKPYWHPPSGTDRFVMRVAPDRSNVAAATVTQRALEHWRPEVLLVVGVAGGILAPGGPALGDVVVPDYVHYAEFRKLTEDADHARYVAYDQPTTSLREDHVDGLDLADAWQDAITEARPAEPELGLETDREDDEPKRPRLHVGPLVAVEKVMGDPRHAEQRRIFERFPGALAVDMESFGVGRAVHEYRREPDYNPRLLIIRGVSDFVRSPPSDDEPQDQPDTARPGVLNADERRRWKPYAAASAGAFAAAVIDEICP